MRTISRDNRRAASHGFGKHIAEALPARREDEGACARHERERIPHKPGQMDPAFQIQSRNLSFQFPSLLAFPQNAEFSFSLILNPGERAQQSQKIFLGRETATAEEPWSSRDWHRRLLPCEPFNFRIITRICNNRDAPDNGG